jgi:cholesterol transport system auxiliary component
MNGAMKHVAMLLLAASLASCAGMHERQPHHYYALEPRPAAAQSAPTGGILIATPTASSFYDTQDIVFSRAAGTRGYYQFNHWTDRPSRVIGAALEARFERRRDGPILATHLVEIYHDAGASPGTVRITLAAEMQESRHRAVVARRTFTRSAPAASADASGAVAGFDEALGGLIEDVAAWVEQEAAPAAQAESETQTQTRRFAHDSKASDL